MSLLIKFIVVGNVSFRHKSQDISMIQYSCRIVKLAIFPYRKAYKNQRIHILCLFCQSKQALPRTVQKSSLQKQILTGISGNAKLREYHDLGMLCFHLFNHFQNCFCICPAICNCNPGRSRRHFNKSLIHDLILFSFSFYLRVFPNYAGFLPET